MTVLIYKIVEQDMPSGTALYHC